MWQIFIDVSGMPPDDIYVGMILFNDNYKQKFLQEFYHDFPRLKNYEMKSTKVHEDDLFRIMRFFDEKRLRMVCYHFNSHQWKWHLRRVNDLFKETNPNHVYRENYYRFNEKLMGILYFYALEQIGQRRDEYNVIACNETCIDIWEVLRTMQHMARIHGWDIKPSSCIRKVEHLLKMADFVAGANRKLADFQLATIGRHIILKDPIKDYHLKKTFKIWPRC